MKHSCILIIGLCVMSAAALTAEEPAPQESRAKHQEGSASVADEQDELSADVQQLVVEQTIPKVIELLTEVEEIMDEATDRLAEADTGGDTIAAQTEIIEKIHAAAKEKQGSGGGGKPGGAMMDMMERMMGKEPAGEQQGGGDKPGDKGGEGQSGLSDADNQAAGGASGGKSEARQVPKASGSGSIGGPEEFRKAFDAYNRGAEKKVK